ncbi:MAG: voltage-gated sodium channel [Saliniramus fredricksonii]|uniref:Voltage-gated sodium channel n=2 Tax=Saliniramus TaxID=2919362 RepID=A0A0P7Y3H3_9HYPH|nr:ion transporter [Saliniramus fredricksonii]KPQ11009.1 MAG: voltage-gated sodium channel [Saliniramus fredricksonii]SCC81851.1 voltage-gated sodium channel [Saliniramus fredricksonii]
MDRIRAFVESRLLERIIMTLIAVNAVTLGLETSAWAMANFGPFLLALDQVILTIFVIEIGLRLAVYRLRFFKNAWNVFDFTVIAIALAPATAAFSVLRALRVLRLLRMITIVPSLKRVVGALIGALPGMGSIVLLLSLLFYVFSVMATKLFAASFPDWFGTIPHSAYTLFQVMTLESWSMGIVRPVMEVYPYAWAFFLPFILSTTFTMLNLFIGIVVNAMQVEHEVAHEEERKAEEAKQQAAQDSREVLAEEIKALRAEIAELRGAIGSRTPAQ